MPQGHVFVGSGHVAAHDAGAAAYVLAADGVTLVRHRAGTLLPLAEGLLDLTDFRALEIANLERHLLEGGGDECKRADIAGVAVSLQNLGGYAGTLYPQFPAHVVLYVRRNVGKIAHGPAHLAGFHPGGGILETLHVAFHLLIPQGPFEAEAGDVGMDSVGAAYAGCGLEFERTTAQHLHEFLQVLAEYGVGLLEQVAVGGVHDVGRSETVVDPFALIAETLADGAGECHHIVAGLFFYLLNAADLKTGVLPYLFHIFRRNHAKLAPGFAGEDFNFQVGAELVLFSPYVPHYLTGIAFNHIACLSINFLILASIRAATSGQSAGWNSSPVMCS